MEDRAAAFNREIIMTKLFALLLLLSSFADVHAQYSSSFPLQPGNRWFYRDFVPVTGPFRIHKVLSDTTMPNGLTYAVVLDSGTSNQVVRYYRQSGARVYQYGFFTVGQEQLVFDFSRATGDTIASFRRGSDTCTITLEYRGSGTIFGMNRPQWYFLINPTIHLTDDQTGYGITDSLGITSVSTFSSLLNVSGALVNGRMFGTFTSVAQSSSSSPDAMHLYQNYPNPFNPTTTIHYQLPTRAHVTLTVFDLLGRDVATLVDGMEEPGEKAATFDGSALASGVYFYRLKVGEFVQTRKLVLVR
jgi:hypothetical protein